MLLDSLYCCAKPLVFINDPEKAHHAALRLLKEAPGLVNGLTGNNTPDKSLIREVAGLSFAGPVGLAAGLDKDGDAVEFWPRLGFGFVEVGTVTAHPQPGNPKPRLFRLKRQRAIINRMGFNNEGSERLATNLLALRESGRWPNVPVGANIGKSKVTPLDQAHLDYEISAKRLAGVADYLTINVSSPNTPGLRELQGKDHLNRLLSHVLSAANDLPVFLKLSPDLSKPALFEAVDLAVSLGISGIIATNTTISRSEISNDPGEAGGLSGAPIAALSREVVLAVLSHIDGKLPVIAVGGISTAKQVDEYLTAGAAAVQIYTSLIYEGPGLPARIHKELTAT